MAPATCTTQILTCSATEETEVYLSPAEDCFSMSILQRSSLCLAQCQAEYGLYPCDGRSTNPSSCVGTTVTWGTTTSGICEVSDIITCHCRASGTYTKATYNAPGQRCI